ncbi:hypothetical protein SEA_RASPUTIA_83 [Microbacterium phage Rasputia]|nr:hypothetical protein SEA_RASPUTIA_83 [Microbacterium phage Rasputia]
MGQRAHTHRYEGRMVRKFRRLEREAGFGPGGSLVWVDEFVTGFIEGLTQALAAFGETLQEVGKSFADLGAALDGTAEPKQEEYTLVPGPPLLHTSWDRQRDLHESMKKPSQIRVQEGFLQISSSPAPWESED